ncbi:cache domain-containing protein [Sulfuricurvum sp.]|uniref:cache domain-containing protein n=1 Tax=Sulfuricurvum sp. TaxID=2025608 RepID=UPI00262E95A4|nr:cache domain-containing protein [Sulfuricurvum sp.]MDD2266191.1 cache domain-containing protein [Sulfuricurvum sp.]MDD2783125.1 cache domain-containing protein [Sulfuricurvum sp.]
MKHSTNLQRIIQALSGQGDHLSNSLARRFLIFVSMAVFILAVATELFVFQQHQLVLEKRFETHMDEVQNGFKVLLDKHAAAMAVTLHSIVNDSTVKKALMDNDRNRLLSDWESVFKRMKKENQITHMYFLDKHRVCLLRVHKPEKRGDMINRFTALEAEWTRKPSSGIEVGPMGTFTLRVIQPVFEGKELIGYVELGKEIEDVVSPLHEFMHNEMAVVLHKEYLNRQGWEEGMAMLNRQVFWDQMPYDVVIYTSQGRLPDPFVSTIMQQHADHLRDHKVLYNGSPWMVSIMPIKDASGKEVGDLVIMNNIMAEESKVSRFVVRNILEGIVFLGLFFSIIGLLLRRIDRSEKK